MKIWLVWETKDEAPTQPWITLLSRHQVFWRSCLSLMFIKPLVLTKSQPDFWPPNWHLCSLYSSKPPLTRACIPDKWKMAIYIDPIFKKGDRSKPENYKAVSRTSVTCKVLEHIVLSSNMNHLESHNILSDAQHGFRKKRSCVSQLVLAVPMLETNWTWHSLVSPNHLTRFPMEG